MSYWREQERRLALICKASAILLLVGVALAYLLGGPVSAMIVLTAATMICFAMMPLGDLRDDMRKWADEDEHEQRTR